jgi:arabinan endo-1,5-alpha-L-arabinosidase
MARLVYRNPIEPDGITIRDPFILRHGTGYYLYGTTRGGWGKTGDGLDAYFSRDLVHWSFAGEVYRRPAGATWNQYQFWAPEVYERHGRYYLFYSANSDDGFRGIGVATATSPLGPFFDGPYNPITPDDCDYLDPHLYTDPGGNHWLLYNDDWPCVGNETLYIQRLSHDLTHGIGQPAPLIRSEQVAWVGTVQSEDAKQTGRIIEGACLVVGADGTHYLMCSTIRDEEYCVGYFAAPALLGPYKDRGLIIRNGGHNSVLVGPDGKALFTSYHSPNGPYGSERLHIDALRLTEDGELVVDQSVGEDRFIEVP